ncbi:unnamed protein product [Allacma fusca]|uniref:Cytochrome P450 n=1 Tax=Allacma fusca TaxID=39272 RepID=A0A8J2P8Y9_9HEXA|nr:unnamed protein product [Allacma fusca]
MWATVVFVFLIFITVFFRKNTSPRKTFPSGPISFPLVGNYLNLLFVKYIKMCDQFIEYGKKYSKVFSFTFGSFPGIIITDPKLAKEALCNKVFNGRPKVETVLIGYKGLLRVEELKAEGGLPISTQGRFSLPLLNLLWQTIGGERLEATDDGVLKVLEAIHGGVEPSLVSAYPWFRA